MIIPAFAGKIFSARLRFRSFAEVSSACRRCPTSRERAGRISSNRAFSSNRQRQGICPLRTTQQRCRNAGFCRTPKILPKRGFQRERERLLLSLWKQETE